jgi:hypothetical protein
MTMTATTQLPDFTVLTEPRLSFHPLDPAKRSIHPLRGLLEHGPYTASIPGAVRDVIRLAAIGPAGEGGNMVRLVQEMRGPLNPDERLAYLPPWPGFTGVFKVGLQFAAKNVSVQLPADLDDAIAASPVPHRVLLGALADGIRRAAAQRAGFDVLVIYLPLRWQAAFRNRDEDFDLHDAVKGITASLGIPSQIVLEDTATTKPHRCSVAWTLGTALYAKAGGVPWKLAAAEPRTAYIGISYALRPGPAGHPRFVTCCSQIFDAEGSGLEFVAYETSEDRIAIRGRNPFLDRGQMRAVMARSLTLYLDRHCGQPPRRVVVHKSTQFRDAEIDGCFDALSSTGEVELIQVIDDTPWRGVQLGPPKGGTRTGRAVPTNYPCRRGTIIHLGGYETLLWTQGDAPDVAYAGSYFKEGVGIPRPLLLRRWAGRGPADPMADEILALTKMNWNNDALYDTLPTTLRYAQTLAQVVKTMPSLQPKPYSYRLFI